MELNMLSELISEKALLSITPKKQVKLENFSISFMNNVKNTKQRSENQPIDVRQTLNFLNV